MVSPKINACALAATLPHAKLVFLKGVGHIASRGARSLGGSNRSACIDDSDEEARPFNSGARIIGAILLMGYFGKPVTEPADEAVSPS
jgi:hypothetical protein